MGNSWADLATSRFIKSDDVKTAPVVYTIKSISKEPVEFQGKKPEMLTLIRFNETEREMIAKTEVCEFLKNSFGLPDHCLNKPVELFFDPDVEFARKKVGGLRLRQPSGDQGPAF